MMNNKYGKILEWGKVIVSPEEITITKFTFDGEANQAEIIQWAIDKLTKALAELEAHDEEKTIEATT